MRATLAVAVGLGLSAAIACARPPRPAGSDAGALVPGADHAPSAERATALRYDIRFDGAGVADIELTVEGGARVLDARAPHGLGGVYDDRGPVGLRDEGLEGRFAVACPAPRCTLRYRYDVALAARRSGDDFAIAVRAGRGELLTPIGSMLLLPRPVEPDAPVEIRVHADRSRFACGLRESGEGGAVQTFSLQAWEVRQAGYGALGELTTHEIRVGESELRVTVLAGPARRADDASLVRWIAASAELLEPLYGRFPADRAHVFVVPRAGSSEVSWGRMLPSGGATIGIELGADAAENDLLADWILVHELVHLGIPSFHREGRWLDEGLATYYEPLLRARAGRRSERQVWQELARGLAKGVGSQSDPPLAHSNAHHQVYWGGALFALAADLDAMRVTGGERRLDDGLRAVFDAGGRAGRIWTVDEFIEVADRGIGAPVLGPLYERIQAEPHAMNGDALASLLADLGVESTPRPWGRPAVTLSPSAPLADLRRRLLSDG